MALNQAKPTKLATNENLTDIDTGGILRTDMQEQYLTRFSLAHKFNVSERTIQRWEEQGMPVFIIGKIHRYELNPVLSWIESRKTEKELRDYYKGETHE